MRRLPSTLWILAPLLLASLYAVAHALFAPAPGLLDVVPRAAVLTARFRGLAALDELWFFARPESERPAEFLGAQRNLPGLTGVAPAGPVHFVLLPAAGRPDPSLLILPVEDAAALERRFLGRDAPEAAARGLERHPHHLRIHGDFAALAWDREIVRRLGEGGLTLADRGEDLGLALDVPGMVALALALGGQEPWRPLLEALDARPAEVITEGDPRTGLRRVSFPAGRAARVAKAWRTARLWVYRARGAIEVELEPADPALRDLLARAASAPPAAVYGRSGAAARLEIPSAAARRALAAVLEACGVKLAPPTVGAQGAAAEAAGLAVSALVNVSEARSWTLDLEAFGGPLPDLSDLLGTLPAPGGSRGLAAGEAPVTLCDLRGGGAAPAGVIVLSADGQRLLLGREGDALARIVPAPAPSLSLAPDLAPPGGQTAIARFSLAAAQVPGLLGRAVARGGLLSVLADGDLAGVVSTDGARLYARVVRRAP